MRIKEHLVRGEYCSGLGDLLLCERYTAEGTFSQGGVL